MAAATVAGPDSHSMEEKKFEYFSSINSMAKKIMQEREKIKTKHGLTWEKMTPQEQDSAIDNCMMDPHIRARYAMHRVDREEVVCYPKLLLQTGQKVVHFGDEDITWQDEHSAPFSWETKSQLEFSLTSGSSDQGIPTSQADSKAVKGLHSSQLSKTASGSKVAGGEGWRPEEESSFWKISAERSKLEGEKADFQSLTPSQIKSLEKGEISLPSYRRQEHEVADSHPPPPGRSTKQRAPKPPAPQPPAPEAVAATPASISISPSPAPPITGPSNEAGWERAQSTLPSVSNTLDEMFSSSLMSKSSNLPTTLDKEKVKEDSPTFDASSTFSQFNTSSNILKTGFDFLDNW
ncbi:uncharacterized protein C1orf198 homolog [Thalassophryne amazonica]|uniref:uncharacterized protein C1orf198 homolog n=1 Tax=Thalassophryne amazonica TaxID=390379 RepID=UPI001470C3A1|nr:uncharacterized protein C1orf198 homolog [Thalassophryne amazonica]